MDETTAVIGMDTAKDRSAVAVAQGGRDGEVRFFGEIDSAPAAVAKLVSQLASRHPRLVFCDEAGPTGSGLYRQITTLGHACTVVAPSRIPTRPGDHVKTNRRDAEPLARLHRAGELTAIWVPDPAHEALRDLSRARQAAVEELRRCRQHLSAFLLRHGRSSTGRTCWSKAHGRWLAGLKFEHPAQQRVLQEDLPAVADAEARRDRLTRELEALVPGWSMAPVVEAVQAMRGVAFLTAVTFVAEVGDVRRFATPDRLMAYLGRVPQERSTGSTVRRGAITKAGNLRARRVLVEGAWTYRDPARVSATLKARLEGQPKRVRDIARTAQTRLCGRYRHLIAKGKKQVVVVTAIAREMAGFLWAIAQEVAPRPV